MKKFTLIIPVLTLAVAQAWAAPVIEVNAESVDFGQVEVGYPVTQWMKVTGHDLTGEIDLAIDGRYSSEYEVFPTTITPEAAANGAMVTVTYKPLSPWSCCANLVLSTADAADVVVPITADAQRNSTIHGYNNQRSYTASVGRMASSVEVAYFADVEIPNDPNPPVVRSIGPISGCYFVSIDGDDCFQAQVIKSSAIVNTCKVRITYRPRNVGTHHATLDVVCPRAGVPLIRVQLEGTATAPEVGDLDGDGMLSINDVTNVIDLLMSGGEVSDQADVNTDGELNITDVISLIDLLLGY